MIPRSARRAVGCQLSSTPCSVRMHSRPRARPGGVLVLVQMSKHGQRSVGHTHDTVAVAGDVPFAIFLFLTPHLPVPSWLNRHPRWQGQTSGH